MKILMTADPLGGVWPYTLELCTGLRTFGVEIALATMGRPLSEAQRAEVGALEHVQVHESPYRLCWMPEPWGTAGLATGPAILQGTHGHGVLAELSADHGPGCHPIPDSLGRSSSRLEPTPARGRNPKDTE